MFEKILEWLRFQLFGCRYHDWETWYDENSIALSSHCKICNKKISH